MSVVNDGHTLISNVLQMLVMTGLLGWSVFFMLRRIAPNFVRNKQYQLATAFNTRGWKKVALWLEPAIATSGGCGSGCNTCGSCPSNPNKAQEQPVQWKHSTPSATPSKSSGCH